MLVDGWLVILPFSELSVRQGPPHDVGINQDEFIDRLAEASARSLVRQGRIIRHRPAILKVFRRALGWPIWLMQAQYYGSYLVTRAEKSLTHKRPSPCDIDEVAPLINKR